jgi:hypothetical protein
MTKPLHSLKRPLELLESVEREKRLGLRHPATRAETLVEKLELDRAIAVLKQAESLGLTGVEKGTVVPPNRVRTPSAGYRIIEDNETEDRALWTESNIEIAEGDVILNR